MIDFQPTLESSLVNGLLTVTAKLQYGKTVGSGGTA